MLCEHGNVQPCFDCCVVPAEQEIQSLKRLLEQSQARVASLEHTGRLCCAVKSQDSQAWLLRKQAEAVESFLSQQAPLLDRYRPQPISEENHCCEFNLLRDRERLHSEAKQLRQLADELEK